MTRDPSSVLNDYFDGELSQAELQALQDWLQQDSQNMQQFVEVACLYNQLHGHLRAQAVLRDQPAAEPMRDEIMRPITHSSKRSLLTIGALAAALLLMVLFLRDSDSAQAGQAELRKVIEASARKIDRTYLIEVEANVIGGARQKRKALDENRPPKPPLDGARLSVRGNSEYVLERKTSDGKKFITGSDGSTSWMVPPTGSVRISKDLSRFNRDVPGHEFSMSLCNLSDALSQLKLAYELSALPVEYADSQNSTSEPTRLLVATKKRGQPGPRRVEITYQENSGQIEQMRFIDMPYGPDRLTVRLSLIQSDSADDAFFHHAQHHDSDRPVEPE